MSVSLSTFQAWLKNDNAVRCVLVEVDVKLSGGSTTTRYFSNTGYVTAAADVPANTIYYPYVSGGVKFTESISLDGNFSLSYGDIELRNVNGELDSWLNDYWSNRRIKVFIGDKSWVRDDFWQIFDGVVTGIDSRKRETLNLKLSDKLQRLNYPVTEAKLGGVTSNADKLLPLCFGECHNVEPLLADPANHEYVVHNGQIEDIIEVRDNGVPVTVTEIPATGRFRLSASPAGQITASVQGAAPWANPLQRSQDIDAAQWTKSGTTIPSSTTAPDGTSTADLMREDTTTGVHQVWQAMTLTIGQVYTMSAYVKAGGRTRGRIMNNGGTAVNTFNTADQTINVSGTASGGGMVAIGNGWYRVWVTWTPTQTTERFQFFLLNDAPASSYTGDNTSGMYLWGTQLDRGSVMQCYNVASLDSSQNTYFKSIPAIIKYIVTTYGNATNRFTNADIDHANFEVVHFLHSGQMAGTATSQVGIYLGERMNVLEVCNKLAVSLGYRLVMTRTGLLQLVRLHLPQAVAGTTVTSADMVDRSLYVAGLPQPKAACQIGYCKNWRVQDNVALGVTESHADLFEQDYLTVTQTDSTAASNFNLYVEPTTEETLLLTGADASAEAIRRLNIFNVQRKQLKYKGFGHLMVEALGSPQTIQHPRYGLSGGVTGQIISMTTDWLQQKADIEVLV